MKKITPPSLNQMRERLQNISRRQILRVVALTLFLIIALPVLLFAAANFISGMGGYYVVSSSMAPMINAGDAVIVYHAAPENINSGDVITYRPPSGGPITTHQVVNIEQRDGTYLFKTKGMANEEADPYLVPYSAVIGVVAIHIPFLGLFVSLASTDIGIVILVIVPSVLLIVNEVFGLFKEVKSTPVDPSTSEPGLEDDT